MKLYVSQTRFLKRWDELVDVEYCCQDMMDAIKREAIIRIDRLDIDIKTGWSETTRFAGLPLRSTIYWRIQFCPFCGERIELQPATHEMIEKHERDSREYERLKAKFWR